MCWHPGLEVSNSSHNIGKFISRHIVHEVEQQSTTQIYMTCGTEDFNLLSRHHLYHDPKPSVLRMHLPRVLQVWRHFKKRELLWKVILI